MRTTHHPSPIKLSRSPINQRKNRRTLQVLHTQTARSVEKDVSHEMRSRSANVSLGSAWREGGGERRCGRDVGGSEGEDGVVERGRDE